MHWAWKAALAGAGLIAFREVAIAVGPRRSRAKKAFEAAVLRAQQSGKPLLVVGNPAKGVVQRLFGPSFSCGHACFSPDGCTGCERQIRGAIEDILPRLPANSAVIFTSGVLESVDDIDGALREITRVSGGDVFASFIDPVTIVAWLAPGAKRRFFAAPPSAPAFKWRALPWVRELQTPLPVAAAQTPAPDLDTALQNIIDVDGESLP